jgi:sugar transferase (PEP-CTERM system associated)
MLGHKRNYAKNLFLFIGDIIFIILSAHLSIWLRLGGMPFSILSEGVLFFLVVYLTMFYIFNLYSLNYKFRTTYYVSRFLSAVFAGTALVAVIFYLFPSWTIGGRSIFILNMGVVSIVVYGWRYLYHHVIISSLKVRSIVIVGAGATGKTIYKILSEKDEFIVKGFLDDNPENIHEMIGTHSVIGDTSTLMNMTLNREIDTAVIAITRARNEQLFKTIVECKMNGLEVYDMPSLYEELTGKLPVKHLNDIWMAFATFRGIGGSVYTDRLKRIVDIVLSIIGLILNIPIMLIVSVAIMLDSRGGILFRQTRVGKDGKNFQLIKLRSMIIDAESDGAVWAKENDKRVTQVGRYIRKLRIDEIPQMYNVLKGDMSFIGPRPERPEFIKKLIKEIPFYSIRHTVKPGLTGWAQVNFRYAASSIDALEKLQYDLYYIKNLSIFLDFHILLKTVRVILMVKGSR